MTHKSNSNIYIIKGGKSPLPIIVGLCKPIAFLYSNITCFVKQANEWQKQLKRI